MLKSELVCESYGYFTNGLRIRGQNSPKVEKICSGGYKLMETVGKNTRTGLQQDLTSNKTSKKTSRGKNSKFGGSKIFKPAKI